ncbi:hypothetical protein BH10ACT8_BH10ACT8_28670 [soil metagenome]|jgi:phage tail-like protein
MRGPISDSPLLLGSAAPVRTAVPAIFGDDPLFLSLCAAVDDLLAPTVVALDCFDAYLDPQLAPTDFLRWLHSLVSCEPLTSAATDTGERRLDIAATVAGHAGRGTVAGIRTCAARAAGVSEAAVTISGAGGVRWFDSPQPSATFEPGPVVLRITTPPGTDTEALSALVQTAVDSVRPINCPLTIEVI